MPYWWSKSCHLVNDWWMHCLGSSLGEERIEEIIEIIFFSEVIFHKISWFLYMLLLLQFFYPRANVTFGTPFGGWFGSTWSLSARRASLKSCYGVKLCLMLVENAVLCQRNYDGFLCYFFYLIITISFQINIQSFVDFQRRILRVSVCFTSFLGLWWSVSKARSIFILKWEGYSHSSVFFPGEYTYLSAWVFRSMIFPYF